MPRNCAACGNNYKNARMSSSKLSFHKFPLKNRDLLNVWLANLKREDFQPSEHSVICSEHFEEKCFTFRNFTDIRILEKNAVPTIFPFHSSPIRERTTFSTDTNSNKIPAFCVAAGCSNSSNKLECLQKKISFHKFPLNNESILKEWLVKLKRKGYFPNQYSNLCSMHFEEDCFSYEDFTNRRNLKAGAIPTKFAYNSNEATPSKCPRLKVNCIPSLNLPESPVEKVAKGRVKASEEKYLYYTFSSLPLQDQNLLLNPTKATSSASVQPSLVSPSQSEPLPIEKDVENYMQHKLQGGRIFLKKDVVPHKFDCQKSVDVPRKKSGRQKKNPKKVVKHTTTEEEPLTACDIKAPIEDQKNDFDVLYPSPPEDMILPDIEKRVSANALPTVHVIYPSQSEDMILPDVEKPISTSSSSLLPAKRAASPETFPLLKVIKQETPDENSSVASDFYDYSSSANYDAASSTTASSEDQFDKFGKHVACQLRELPLKNALVLQEAIQSLITKERIACLTSDGVLK